MFLHVLAVQAPEQEEACPHHPPTTHKWPKPLWGTWGQWTSSLGAPRLHLVAGNLKQVMSLRYSVISKWGVSWGFDEIINERNRAQFILGILSNHRLPLHSPDLQRPRRGPKQGPQHLWLLFHVTCISQVLATEVWSSPVCAKRQGNPLRPDEFIAKEDQADSW